VRNYSEIVCHDKYLPYFSVMCRCWFTFFLALM
jgi:hypothetical protein